jgi:hypothetical protein
MILTLLVTAKDSEWGLFEQFKLGESLCICLEMGVVFVQLGLYLVELS